MALSQQCDAIVVGLGGMGSAVAYHLARRGLAVLGLEQFEVPHEMGSSHGLTRIIRLGYSEHPSYVPLLRRAYALWKELEQAAGEQLLFVTGSIDAGPPEGGIFEGSRRSCELFDLRHEILTSAELTRRFPGYYLPASTMAVFQPDGGFLLPERCILAHASLARKHGAKLHVGERAIGWEPAGEGVRVISDRAAFVARKLVLAAGPWIGQLEPLLAPMARPERQVLAWLQPKRLEYFVPERFPVFNIEVPEGRYYGLPAYGIAGLKLGRYHHLGEPIDPSSPSRECSEQDEKVLRDFADRYFPDGSGPALALKACIFTDTPDEHFILDFHPRHRQVCIASPCSGHGFKFCSVVGEIMADLVERGETAHDISLHRLARLLPPEVG